VHIEPPSVSCSTSRTLLNISLHAFPVDGSVRAQWLENIRRDNFTPTHGTRVCSRHFPPGNIVATPGGLRRLKRGSVPLLFHWNNYSLPRPSTQGDTGRASDTHGEGI
uniref:THAP domain-containing protein 1 n=1 Tax=Periophthalmus magnuspinnatus TaxID=409849 RepID=A0A3B4AF08_9GOBI